MSDYRICLGTLKITRRGRELVMDVLRSNRLSYGPCSRQFEETFAAIHGVRHAVLSNSGTSSLHVTLAALKELHGWADGDEVLVPAVTFVATVNVVLHNRMRPVLVDVDPVYYEMDPGRIAEAVTPRTRAVLPVHLFGQPADMDPILEIASSRGLKVLEDSAETMFARYQGRFVGGLGDAACFSTYVAHLLTTGVGGLTTTNDADLAVAVRSLVNHGRDSIYISMDDDSDLSPERRRMVMERRFSFVRLGHSFRITEMEAALGLAQLETWEDMIARRRHNGSVLTRGLGRFEDRLQLPSIRPGCEHSFMMFPIVLREGPKEDLTGFLEDRGIETRQMLPITNQPVYAPILDIPPGRYEVAEWINRGGFYIGCHQDLTDEDLEYVVDAFGGYWKR